MRLATYESLEKSKVKQTQTVGTKHWTRPRTQSFHYFLTYLQEIYRHLGSTRTKSGFWA